MSHDDVVPKGKLSAEDQRMLEILGIADDFASKPPSDEFMDELRLAQRWADALGRRVRVTRKS